MRAMCDDFGLQHKVVIVDGEGGLPAYQGRRQRPPSSQQQHSSDESGMIDDINSNSSSSNNNSSGIKRRSGGRKARTSSSSSSQNGSHVLRVWKGYAHVSDLDPPTLSEILRKDARLSGDAAHRRLDALPLYWKDTRQELLAASMDEEKLCAVVQRTVNAMKNYPMPGWALLLLELLRERGLPLPLGSLRCAMKMCAARNDLYGLLEVLHLAHDERNRAQAAAAAVARSSSTADDLSTVEGRFFRTLQRLRTQPRYGNDFPTGFRSRFGSEGSGGDSDSGEGRADSAGLYSEAVAAELEQEIAEEQFAAIAPLADIFVGSSGSGGGGVDDLDGSTSGMGRGGGGGIGGGGGGGAALRELQDGWVERLSSHDWNRACLLAFRAKHANVPLEAYREAFTEVN